MGRLHKVIIISITLQVMGIETFSAIGVAMLVFSVLPLLDNVLQAVIIMPALAFIPSVLRIFNRPAEEERKPLKVRIP